MIVPLASVVRICVGVWYSVVEPLPAIEKYTSAFEDDATWNSGRLVVVVACTANEANGVVVPIPTRCPPARVMARTSVEEVAHLLGAFEVPPPPEPAQVPSGSLKQPLVS